MDKGDGPGMKTDSSVPIASCSPIFQITLNVKTNGCQLCPDLMVPPCMKVYFQQMVVVGGRQKSIIQFRYFASIFFYRISGTLIVLTVSDNVMDQGGFFFLGAFIYNSPIYFLLYVLI